MTDKIKENKCNFMEHEVGWGGDCYCCGKCGAVFIKKSLLEEIIEEVEGMHECWCGGGKHLAKSRAVIHTAECALNNQGFYEALNKVITILPKE